MTRAITTCPACGHTVGVTLRGLITTHGWVYKGGRRLGTCPASKKPPNARAVIQALAEKVAQLRDIFPRIATAAGFARHSSNASMEFIEYLPNAIEDKIRKLECRITAAERDAQTLRTMAENPFTEEEIDMINQGTFGI